MHCHRNPDKTFIGRIKKGFDFPGYHFSRAGLTVARATIERFVERALRLYEQERERPGGPSRLETYVRRWVGWAEGGRRRCPTDPIAHVVLEATAFAFSDERIHASRLLVIIGVH